MTKKPKLLWVADFPAKTGFGRVSGALLPRLREQGDFEIVVLGCNWHGDPCEEQKLFKIYPASNRFQQAPFGENRIREIVEREKPDLIFSLNDPWIVSAQYKEIEDLHKQNQFKFVGYLTMDSYDWIGGIDPHINNWDALVAFTEFGAYEFVKAGIKIPIAVIPHGLDTNNFYPMDRKEARKNLGLNPDDWIVLNGNRNQFRKLQNLTISAFAKFAVGRPDTKLYMHCGLRDQGWPILELFGREMHRQGLEADGRIIMTTQTDGPPDVSVEVLNWIYNSANVGVNTCKGGGFELVNFENAACKVAQIVPDHTATKELFEGYGKLIRCDYADVDTNMCRIMPCPSDDHLAEILGEMYESPSLVEKTAEACYQRVTDPQFSWDTVASQFGGIFEDVMNEKDHSVPPEISKKPRKQKKNRSMRKQKAHALA
jgi:glycosyltransferase involved in cell wall biosynthesis